MKLLTSDVGWAATNKNLFWTTDGGAKWKDITPKVNHKRQMLSSIFFLDSSTGWAVIACGDDRDAMTDDVCFEVASTADAGENWSIVHPKIVDPVPNSVVTEDGQGFSGATFLDFADSQHGWAILKRNLPVGRSSGEILRTLDGGRTWTQLAKNTLPIAGNLSFENTQDGWMAGGPDGGELYFTHDAGTSWNEMSLPKPTDVGPDVRVVYSLPVFEGAQRAFITVRYAVGPLMGPDMSTLALFATDDGGTTWKQDRILPRIPDIYCSDVSGSVLIAAHSEQKEEHQSGRQGKTITTTLSLYTLDRTKSAASNASEVPSQGAATQLSFVGPDEGWVNFSDSLFATRDGGRSWTRITPSSGVPPAPTMAEVVPLQMNSDDFASRTSPSQQALGNIVSAHLGFDGTNVPTIPQMTRWMTYSPFYDAYIYLPHSPNRHNDPILSSANGPTWVSSVESQGWGIVPIWFGLQSTCVITQTGITQFINLTPATASTQGAQQADAAVAQDQILGILSGIIYLDIENYTVGGACSAAVQAYVDGFVSEIGVYSGYSAGVYANPGPINSDISKVTPAPSAIWISKADNQVTIWNQGILDSSSTNSMFWPNDQRLHQFLINTNANNAPNVTWGGVPLSIDEDIDNGPVVNANAGAKTYSSYTYTQFDYPGATATFAYGINDIYAGHLINATGQVGQIVGYYLPPGSGTNGFLYDAVNGWSSFSYPGAAATYLYGINNSGQMVGAWQDSNATVHGFSLKNGTYTSLDPPSSTTTFATGINDAGQIVGWYYGLGGYQGFLYYLGKFYPFSYPGALITQELGINGDGTIVGFYDAANSTQPGFVRYAIPPSWTGTLDAVNFPGSSGTLVYGINNAGEMTGTYICPSGAYCGFQYSDDVLFTSFQYTGSTDTDLQSANDFGQATGYYDTPTSIGHGLLVVGQP